MLFATRTLAILASISIFANALPLDTKARDFIPRQKSYAIVNVDGGSTQVAQATTVIRTTKTVEIVNSGPTVTVVEPAPKPTPTSSSASSTSASSSSSSPSSTPTPASPPSSSKSASRSSSSTSKPTPSVTSSASSSISTPVETPKPIFVTVTVSNDDGPTEYYDNGLWHTMYRIKTFEKAALATAVVSSTTTSCTTLPVLTTLVHSWNQTST
jgi:hypothetical protein